jgi:hypothetical protein
VKDAGRSDRRGRIVVGAITALALGAAAVGCGSDEGHCPIADAGADDGNGSDDGGAPGMVHVIGNFTNMSCPAVNPITIGPDNGGTVDLEATFVSPAGDEDAGATVLWSATNGIFANAHALDTTFMCVDYGLVTVTLTVHMSGCSEQAQGMVNCDTLTGQGGAGPI